jgi:hypothetical protein
MRALTATPPSFFGVAFAGVSSVLLFGASVVEDALCISGRAAGMRCNILPPWFYWVTCLVALAFVVWSSYWWWSAFMAVSDKQLIAQTAVPNHSLADADSMRGMMGQPLDRRTVEIQRLAHAEWLQEGNPIPSAPGGRR